MSAIATGMALHGGFIPYTATFLIFMEYARNAVTNVSADEAAEYIRLYPRFYRTGRGWTNSPTD